MAVYFWLLVGFILLIKGADFFVEGSSSVARLFKIPSIIIGLTIVAFGTSMPEASVSITAALDGQNELALSNVIGSNIFNLLVVVGICACIRSMPISASILKRELPFSILVTLVLLAITLDGTAGMSDGILLLALFVLFLIYTIHSALKNRTTDTPEETKEKSLSPLISFVFIAGGLAGIVIGGDMVVNSASSIAASFGLSQTLIGLTIVALGTSLPELVTSIVASKKGENDIAMGNVVGSNIFNILLVLGSSAALHPISVNALSLWDMAILIGVSLLTMAFAWHKKEVGRLEGIIMVVVYAAFMLYIIIR